YPAIDVLKSISRTLPGCHDEAENEVRLAARRILSTYGDMEEMVRLGAYKSGSNDEVDEAIRLAPQIEALLKQGKTQRTYPAETFAALAGLLARQTEEVAA
ncbi:MAG TPA: flagellum-specific ATP synthase FliI, partial [Sphingomonas sp.]